MRGMDHHRGHIIEDYAEHLIARGMAQATIKARRDLARRALHAWGEQPSPTQIVAFLDDYSGWTRRTYHGHLSDWCAFLAERTGSRNAAAIVRKEPLPRPRPHPLTADELVRLRAVADRRADAWVLLGALAGLRVHEMAKVRAEDVTREAIYVVGKGRQAWTVPTHPDLWELASRMPAAGPWFPSPQHDRSHVSASLVGGCVRNLFRQVGLTGGAHRLRATYGTNLARSGVKLHVVQQLLRHQSLSSTQHYLGVSDDEKRAAIAALVA